MVFGFRSFSGAWRSEFGAYLLSSPNLRGNRKDYLMRMRPSRAAHAAGTRIAGAGGFRSRTTRAGGEHGKFFCQLGRAAVRALGALPLTRTHQHFAILLALLAMKFVNRHECKVAERRRPVERQQRRCPGGALKICPPARNPGSECFPCSELSTFPICFGFRISDFDFQTFAYSSSSNSAGSPSAESGAIQSWNLPDSTSQWP